MVRIANPPVQRDDWIWQNWWNDHVFKFWCPPNAEIVVLDAGGGAAVEEDQEDRRVSVNECLWGDKWDRNVQWVDCKCKWFLAFVRCS